MKNIMKGAERPKGCQPSYYDSMKLGTLPKDVEYLSEYMHRHAKEQFS